MHCLDAYSIYFLVYSRVYCSFWSSDYDYFLISSIVLYNSSSCTLTLIFSSFIFLPLYCFASSTINILYLHLFVYWSVSSLAALYLASISHTYFLVFLHSYSWAFNYFIFSSTFLYYLSNYFWYFVLSRIARAYSYDLNGFASLNEMNY